MFDVINKYICIYCLERKLSVPVKDTFEEKKRHISARRQNRRKTNPRQHVGQTKYHETALG